MSIFKDILNVLRGGIGAYSPTTVVGPYQIPDLTLGGAYAANDAFGGMFTIAVPKFGTITDVIFYDRDDEGLNKDLVLFTRSFSPTANDAPIALRDDELKYSIGPISVDSWTDLLDNRLGRVTPALSYVAPQGKLWGQWVTRGADNIASGSEPLFALVIGQ